MWAIGASGVDSGASRRAGLRSASLSLALWVSALVFACGPADTGSPSSPKALAASRESSGMAPAQPLVAVVDTDRVLSASPGQGVGIFTEYASGGQWHIWWTCDTAVTGKPCDFAVHAAVTGGEISDIESEGLGGQAVVRENAQEVSAAAVTTSAVAGLTFSAPPGKAIELGALLNGVPDGDIFFFAQDGAVNGGYPGPLSDPVTFVPSEP